MGGREFTYNNASFDFSEYLGLHQIKISQNSESHFHRDFYVNQQFYSILFACYFKCYLKFSIVFNFKTVRYWLSLDKTRKDTLEIPLTVGLRKRAGLNGWFFGPTINAFYINFIKPWTKKIHSCAAFWYKCSKKDVGLVD